MTSSVVCDISFELARHEFQRITYVFRDLRVVDIMVLCLPWLDDEYVSLPFGTTRRFTLMHRTNVETKTKERRP
jgi:hypothetical protein